MSPRICTIVLSLCFGFLTACGGGGGGSSTPSGGVGGTTSPETPTISVNGGTASTSGFSIKVNEGSSDVASVSTSVGSLSIVTDSSDAASFNLSNGELTFSAEPDFESPGDANGDNVYEFTVRATNSTVSTNVPITVTVANLFEGAGRVIDGPVRGASVFVDSNCNSELDDGEVNSTTDEAGFYVLPGATVPDGSECSPTILSIGGTDTATQVERTKLVLKISINDLDAEEAVLTPLSSLLAEFDTEEEKLSLLEALILQDVTIQDLLEFDPWADASQSDDADKKLLGQTVQRLNAQIVTISDTVLALVSDTDASAQEVAVATAAISKAIGESLIANSNADASTLADNAVLSSAINSAFVAAEVAIQEQAAENAGEPFDQTVAETEAKAKAELLSPIITQATSVTSLANSVLADESVDPLSTLAAATARSAQTLVVSEISTLITEIRQLEAEGSSTTELAVQVAESASSLADLLSPRAIAERIQAEGGDLGDLDTDGDGILNPLDSDDDGDGIADAVDDFALDPAASKDTDGDGAPDDWNEGQGASDSTSQQALMLDDDDDDDSIEDSADNCPLVQNTDQINSDSDDDGNACDDDDDNDGKADTADNCPLISNADQLNADSDAFGNACDDDDDNDGEADAADNCPLVSNADQLNADSDAFGNACDEDDDNDSIDDDLDNCPLVANVDQANSDQDSIGDACDSDDDDDGVADNLDNCPVNANAAQGDLDGDGAGDACDPSDDRIDTDGDGVYDSEDNCPAQRNAAQQDSDGDFLGNVCDDDDDGDGVADSADTAPLDAEVGAVGFSLDRLAFEDHINGRARANLYGLDISKTESTLSATIAAGLIDRSNLNAVLAKQGTEVGSPKVLLFLDKLPGEETSGTFEVKVTLLDGADGSRDGLERLLESGVTLEWQSTDSGIQVTAPSQTLTIRFREGSTSLIAEILDVEPRVVTLNPSVNSQYAGILEFDLLKLFTSELPSNIPVEDYFDTSEDYYVTVSIDQGDSDQFYYRGESFNSIELAARIVDVDVPVLADSAWNISNPSIEDFPDIDNLPATTETGVLDLPESPIALAFPTVTGPDEFLSAVPILYGDTAIVYPPDLSTEQLEALGNSRLSGPSEVDPKVPSLFLILEKPPEANGSVEIELKLYEGQDAIYDQGEILLGANMLVDWSRDNQSSDLTFAASKLTLYIVDSETCAVEDGTEFSLGEISTDCKESVSNFDPNIATYSMPDSGLPPIVKIRLANLLIAGSSLEIGPGKDLPLSRGKEWRLVATILGSESSMFLEDQPIRAVELRLSQ